MRDESKEERIRRQFNAVCRKTIKNKAADLKKEYSRRRRREVYFEELPILEQNRICAAGSYELCDEEVFCIEGRCITGEELRAAIAKLPELKKVVINLYYFEELTDKKVGEALGLSRKSSWYHRNSGEELLRKLLGVPGHE